MYRIVFLFLLSFSTFLVVGQDIPTSGEIWDFEVGDKYGYYINYDGQMGCNLLKEVTSKTTNGNYITYHFATSQMCYWNGGQSNSAGFDSLTVSFNGFPFLFTQYDTISFWPDTIFDTAGQLIPDSCIYQHISDWNTNCSEEIDSILLSNTIYWDRDIRSDTQLVATIVNCNDSVWIKRIQDYNDFTVNGLGGDYDSKEFKYAKGLGKIYDGHIWSYGASADGATYNETTELTYYHKVGSFPCNVGLSDFNFKTPITIYPNPNNGSFAIKGLEANATYELSVINVQGKTVHNCSYSKYKTLEINHLKSGIYFLQLFNKAELTTFKFVKK